jgi:bacteriorhodopsin
MAGNHALDVNPPTANIHINTHGSDWLWALFAIFALYTLLLLFHSLRTSPTSRFFHHLLLAALLVATISTFTLASDLGNVPVVVEFVRKRSAVAGATRQVFYVRYIDWFLTTPLLLSALLFAAAVPVPTVFITCLFADAAVVSGLVGALVSSTYKWGYYTFALVSIFYVIYAIVLPARKSALALGSDVQRAHSVGSLFVLLLPLLYAICWGVSEGGNVIGSDGEAAFYGVLDLIAKVGFSSILLWNIRDVQPGRLGIRMRGYDEEIPGARNAEKNGV